MDISLESIDELFQSYNYQIAPASNNKLRIYTLRYGMYHAAELIKFDESFDESSIKAEYSENGYATEVKVFSSKEEIEEYLFEGFFIKTPLGNELKRRYTQFVNRQLKNLPEKSKYEYINGAFEIFSQDENGVVVESNSYNDTDKTSLLDKINLLVSETKGAILIIIEAAAGFGKTCTANEILNTFSALESKKLPFFTELSRNREARVFKHILLNEIDEQFPNGIKQNIVIEQIAKGRIPLIIDGFDELISTESKKEDVESMFTTIVDLLKGEAKIIITSRKTAMFSSKEFFNTIDTTNNKFSLARIEIKEPSVNNWLSSERIDLIQSKGFPLEHLANPVLLSYLRNIPIEKLKAYLSNEEDNSLVDKYINYLLKREQERQNLKISVETQLRIFRKLIRFMTEYNITAETKETIKDFLKDYNTNILKTSLNDYTAEEKPSLEDLIETLSNHVFLDRKASGMIGFVNDFIFGLLVGENLLLGKYKEYYPNINEILPQDFAIKAVQAFKIQPLERQEQLWSVFNQENSQFSYDTRFFFDLDYYFMKKFNKKYLNLFITDYSIKNVSFDSKATFTDSVFSSVIFNNCFFDLNVFNNCTFQNCFFDSCSIIPIHSTIHFNDFAIFASSDNNGFLDSVSELINCVDNKNDPLSDFTVLKKFFHPNRPKPVPRKISYIRKVLLPHTSEEISKKISTLKSNKHLFFKDDIAYISQKGITYFNQINNSLS
ncbi:MAG: hypothetical protein A3F72_01565 [Bacteroidetes bacterium RIFCSPLOWO2_12_FULL_35_15]|nr:MAG: hypothetical protein A3F72_01565 [Bacteroidetes bacterium RIFCSPLOWO2_12_FULL_35_15]